MHGYEFENVAQDFVRHYLIIMLLYSADICEFQRTQILARVWATNKILYYKHGTILRNMTTNFEPKRLKPSNIVEYRWILSNIVEYCRISSKNPKIKCMHRLTDSNVTHPPGLNSWLIPSDYTFRDKTKTIPRASHSGLFRDKPRLAPAGTIN